MTPTAALAEARARDTSPPRGPLHGMPVGVKDIIDTADMPTGYGSPICRGHRPDRDAAASRCPRGRRGRPRQDRHHGVRHFTPGRTANPHNLARTPGGSSSGSAAAVADRMVPLALGTQTAGSIIRPAAFCGVVGYKPSFGTISRSGVLPFAESLDTVGALSVSVADAALLASVAARRADLLVRDTPGPVPRVAVHRSADWELVSAGSQAALIDAARRLARAGAAVSDAVLPGLVRRAAQRAGDGDGLRGGPVVRAGASRARRPPQPELRALLDEGAGLSPKEYLDALGLAQAGRQELAALFERHDLVLTPSAPGEAPLGLGATGDPVFNRTWTLLGTPCVTCRPAPASTASPLAPSSSAGLATTPASWRRRRGQSGSSHELQPSVRP